MELRQVRCFVAVAEELHFGRAAERLLLGQPAVSQHIRRLERELRVELFDRSPRHVRLTAAGELFLPGARRMLAAEEEARASVAELAEGRTGVLRLGTVSGLGPRLDRILDAYERHAPGVRVELVSLPVKERLAQLAGDRLDAAFVRAAVPDDSPELRLIPLWEEELLIALPARHPLAAGDQPALPDLAGLPLRLTDRRTNPALVDLVVNACHEAGFEPVTASAGGTLHDTLAAVGAGAPTWTVVYAANAAMTSAPRVVFRRLRDRTLTLRTSLAVRRSRSVPRVLLAACREQPPPCRPGVPGAETE
ncbi:LysR substrate-binding domain-containing protein [Nonomuraea rhodomycinica]|uniref:LysR family transcriptional regulator n=1 Tax=Nonomuraea rhodomycinica TaxID=1712872 RepID=A0A7Y6MBU8_9ACTN|nr:LysR substrate-binding domain-containing protein [Nonomuraea rhodomycinica]NUW40864.1 LysR family transcriptional regulator [Nonomuraea rhodomycinica]